MRLFFLILFVLLSNTIFGASNLEIKKYYYADEWAWNPQIFKTKYSEFPLSNGIKFYSDINKQSSPDFTITDTLVRFSSKMVCHLSHKQYTKKPERYLSCDPYHCVSFDNKLKSEVDLLDPFHTEWFSVHTDPVESCPRQISIDIRIIRDNLSQSFSWIFSDGEEPHVVLDGVKYFPDLSFCKRMGASTCKAGLASNDFENRKKKSFEDANKISKIGTCFSNGSDIGCLKSHTLTNIKRHPFFKTFGGGDVASLGWDEENISELKECLKPGAGVDINVYMGIKKKCLFLDGKIAIIDYPEAFIKFHRFNENQAVNFEQP